MLFSERNKIRVKVVGPTDMPYGVKNRIWSVLEGTVFNDYEGRERNNLVLKIWTEYFKQTKSSLKGQTSFQ